MTRPSDSPSTPSSSPTTGQWGEETERIARAFHETYEEAALVLGYKTRPESRVPWEQVPEVNREVMRITVFNLLNRGVLR